MGATVVMVTHDPVAASYADRVVFLADGRIVGEMTEPSRDGRRACHPTGRGRRTGILGLAWRTLRARRSSFVGAFLTLALAVALVTAFGTVLESALRAGAPTERFAGAAVAVAAKQTVMVGEDSMPLAERARIDASLVGRIAHVLGVQAAEADVSFPAYLVGSDGALLPGRNGQPSWGHAWSSAALTPFRLVAGHAPTGPQEVVVDADLARRAHLHIGDQTAIQATKAVKSYKVVGIAGPAVGPPLQRQSTLLFSDAEAARLYGHPGRADAIGVLSQPGVDASRLGVDVQHALASSEVAVYTGHDRGEAEFLDVAETRQTLLAMSGSVGGLAMMVAVFVVAGTFALAVQQRHREIGLLRAVAGTPGQVRRMLAGEAMVVGLAAAGVAVLAVSLATHSTSTADAAPAVVMTFMVAVALLGPMVAQLAATVTGALLQRVSRMGGFLAAANTRANSRRLASAITPWPSSSPWPAPWCSSRPPPCTPPTSRPTAGCWPTSCSSRPSPPAFLLAPSRQPRPSLGSRPPPGSCRPRCSELRCYLGTGTSPPTPTRPRASRPPGCPAPWTSASGLGASPPSPRTPQRSAPPWPTRSAPEPATPSSCGLVTEPRGRPAGGGLRQWARLR